MERTRKPVKAVVEKRKVHKHINTDPVVQRMAGDALFHGRPFLMIDQGMAVEYGLNFAAMVSFIYNKFKYYDDKNQLQKDGSFFIRHEDIQKYTGLTEYSIRKTKKELVELGWITTKMKGLPSKEYYYIHLDTVVAFYSQSSRRNSPYENDRAIPYENDRAIPYENDRNIYNIKGNQIKDYDIKDIGRNEQEGLLIKKEKKVKVKKSNISPDQFEEFWKLYPKKVGKKDVQKKWEVLSRKPMKDQPTFQEIKEAIQEQSKSDQWQDPRYIPNPATWLNQEKWNDELSPARKNKGNNRKIAGPCEYGSNVKVVSQTAQRTQTAQTID